MRVTINFKGELGELLAQAKEMSGIENISAVCNEALKDFVERERARRLNLLMKPHTRDKMPKQRKSK
jgi:hypothetical protein